MTRRIALAIFATVTLLLIAGGLVAFFTTRASLLAQLDESLIDRALSVPVIAASQTSSGPERPRFAAKDDRYVVRTEVGRTIASQRADEPGANRPVVVGASFFRTEDGRHGRSVTIRTLAQSSSNGGPAAPMSAPIPVTVTYSGSCQQFDTVMFRLGLTLSLCVIVGGVLTALISIGVAKRALRPLRQTAEAICAIDDQQLHERLETAALPPEVAPIGERLNEMLERLETASLRRKRFLADISHELRTPLAAMGVALQVTLRHPRGAAEYRDAMEASLSEVRHLRRLVDLLTEQARAELTANQGAETFNLIQLLRECKTLAEGLALTRQMTLTLQLGGDEPLVARGEPDRLRSALINILSNAIEYGRVGGNVELSCSPSGDQIAIRVRDDGPGVAPEDLPHLFEPFYRANAPRGGESGHFGLGLFITQTHIRAMGGTCTVSSNPGSGTIFEILLPNPEGGDAPRRSIERIPAA